MPFDLWRMFRARAGDAIYRSLTQLTRFPGPKTRETLIDSLPVVKLHTSEAGDHRISRLLCWVLAMCSFLILAAKGRTGNIPFIVLNLLDSWFALAKVGF
jgi:hypothetical protein